MIHEFSVCSWNVLAQSYCRSDSYTYCKSSDLTWNQRKINILKHLAKSNLSNNNNDIQNNNNSDLDDNSFLYDIICLQEVDKYHDFYEPELSKLGYESIYVQRGLNSIQAKPDGLVIAWKRDKYNLIYTPEVVDYNDLATQTREIRHNIGCFIYLQPLSPSNSDSTNNSNIKPFPPILVANTHLYWNPLYEELKFKQMIYFIKRIEKSLRIINKSNGFNNQFNGLSINETNNNYPILSSVSLESMKNVPFQCNNFNEIPVILVGDFNSTPASLTYNYVKTGLFDPKTETERKFIVGTDLYKIAKNLRSVGYDCEYWSEKQKKELGFNGLFEKALKENRVILTKSKTLVARRNCPPAYLLPRSDSADNTFIQIVLHLGLPFNRSNFYSRCTLCNSDIFQLDLQELQNNPPNDFPLGLRSGVDESGKNVTFYRCVNKDCNQLYWWGHGSETGAKHFELLFQQVEKLNTHKIINNTEDKNEDEKESKSIEDSILSKNLNINGNNSSKMKNKLDPSEFVYSGTQRHSFKFVSAYCDYSTDSHSAPCEPQFTNYTANFRDCLDYIFYTNTPNNNDWKIERLACESLLSETIIAPLTGCPNAIWPSDHMKLAATFRLHCS